MRSRRVEVVLGRLFWCFKSIGAFATINRSINTFTVVAACVGTDDSTHCVRRTGSPEHLIVRVLHLILDLVVTDDVGIIIPGFSRRSTPTTRLLLLLPPPSDVWHIDKGDEAPWRKESAAKAKA